MPRVHAYKTSITENTKMFKYKGFCCGVTQQKIQQFPGWKDPQKVKERLPLWRDPNRQWPVAFM